MCFSVLLAIFGALFDNLPALQAFVDPKFYGYSLVVIAIIVAILRSITKTPLE
jgi:hypothetical protein